MGCDWKIHAITVLISGGKIQGLMTEYISPEKEVKKAWHGNNNTPDYENSDRFELGPDEFIMEIYGKFKEQFEYIGFRTNLGRDELFGLNTGNGFTVSFPLGSHLFALGGCEDVSIGCLTFYT